MQKNKARSRFIVALRGSGNHFGIYFSCGSYV